MARIKEFRIDAFSYPMNSSHLVINDLGNVKTFNGINVKLSKIKKKVHFFNELEGALLLDFKNLYNYKETDNYYHISVIYDDGQEESHFYKDTLKSNAQDTLIAVLKKYIDKDYLIDVVKD